MADSIETLPIDNNPVNHDEIKMVDTLFKHKNNISNVVTELKDSIAAGILFGLFLTPYPDKALNFLIPITKNSQIIMFIVKILLFVILLYVIKNFALAKR